MRGGAWDALVRPFSALLFDGRHTGCLLSLSESQI